jgi:Gas vesicle synthesis protein GvpL/GvpF
VYVYGIARAGANFQAKDGVLGGTVSTIEHRKLAAIAGQVSHRHVRAKRRDLLRHSDVLQQAFADGIVLPFRFGVVFPDAQALVDEVLEPRQDELLELLDRFADAGELRLRAAYHDRESILADIVRSDPSIARLREQSRGRSGADPKLLQLGEAVAHAFAARRSADADAIVSRLAKHADEIEVDEPAGELEVVRASFLVRRRKTAKFDELLESVALSHRHLITFTCTGPVPPHSFVDLDGA